MHETVEETGEMGAVHAVVLSDVRTSAEFLLESEELADVERGLFHDSETERVEGPDVGLLHKFGDMSELLGGDLLLGEHPGYLGSHSLLHFRGGVAGECQHDEVLGANVLLAEDVDASRYDGECLAGSRSRISYHHSFGGLGNLPLRLIQCHLLPPPRL